MTEAATPLKFDLAKGSWVRDKILKCIYAALEETNRERRDDPLPLSPDTELHGSASALDSLELINLIVAIEDSISSDLGWTIVLSDDRPLSMEPSPFRTVEALAEYVELLLKERK